MSKQKKNVLMIFSDHLRADTLGCLGNRYSETPHINALSDAGTLFTRATVTQPTCTPSRASVLTGRMPSALRTRMVGCSLPDNEITLPAVLSENGYRTVSIGKLHLRPQRDEIAHISASTHGGKSNFVSNGGYYGFQEVDLVDGHGDACCGNRYTEWLNSKYPGWGNAERIPAPDLRDTYISRIPLEGWSSIYIRERTMEFLNSEYAAEQPFFLHVSFPDPHPMARSFTVPAPYDRKYSNKPLPEPTPPFESDSGVSEMYTEAYHGRISETNDYPIGTPATDFSKYTAEEWYQITSRYYGMVSLLDESVGMILNSLRSSGLAENTYVIFLSDHGDYLGDHGMYGKGFCFESALHVPMIFTGADIRHQRCESIASTLDITPTILDLLEINEPVGIQGISFAGYLRSGEGYTRRAALSENDDDMAGLRIRTLTSERYQLNLYAGGYIELFDHEKDPRQTRNLWHDPEYADALVTMKGMMSEELICAFDTVNGRTQKPRPVVKKYIAFHNQGKYNKKD